MEHSTPGDMVLGSQPIARLLIISCHSDHRLEAAQGIQAILQTTSHQISVTTADEWRDTLSITSPEVVLIDCPANTDAAGLEKVVQLCGQIKSAPGGESALVAAALPQVEGTETARAWEVLHAACADDLWSANASRAELEVRIELLSRMCRLSRDLSTVREQLSKHLQTDDATQLLTRRFFFQAAFREVSRARRYGHHLSALMIDIDFLDNINRKFGDSCGDYVLRAVAHVVRQWTRDSDTVARFSDHKFVALLPETTIDNAALVREKIMKAINETNFEWHGDALPVSVSIGEAECTPVNNFQVNAKLEDEDSEAHSLSVREELAALLEDADAALSVAKKTAKRPTIFVEYSPGEVGLPGPE